MTNMNEFIKDLYLSNKYEFIESINNIFDDEADNYVGIFNNSDAMKKDYHFVVNIKYEDLKTSDGINNVIEKIVDEVWNDNEKYKVNKDKEYKKNSSLLILLELDTLQDEEKIRNIIYDIEESTYYFKRYIITYTKNQMIKLEAMINNGRSIMDIASDKDLFLEYKNNKNGESEYNLVAKIFIKMPFLKYEIKENDINNLSKSINKKLGEKDLEWIRDSLFSNCEYKNNDYYKIIDKIQVTQEEIEERLKKIMDNLCKKDK